MTQGTKLAGMRRFRFFNDQTYHFQTLRALNDIPYGGADTAEILQTIVHIKAGDADSWYCEGIGDRVSELARRTQDPISTRNHKSPSGSDTAMWLS